MKLLRANGLICLGLILSLGSATAEPPPFKSLRFEEDYRYLRDADRRGDGWDSIKYLPLNADGSAFVSLGGEIRERYEYFDHPAWGSEPTDFNGYFLQRYMLHADLHLGEKVRAFVQLKSGLEGGLEGGRNGGPRPTDKDELDLHQAFVDFRFSLNPRVTATLRAGRQELAFGSQRLVSVRESPNIRQSFDGARLMVQTGVWRLDLFATKPVETDPDRFDDQAIEGRAFWGAYAVAPLPLLPGGNIDLYYFGLSRNDARFDQGTGDEVRHSVGARIWGEKDAWDYNAEFVYQFGRFGGADIRAWTAASDTGYTFAALPWQPRLGLKADFASGDRDPLNPELGTFNALFPKGGYFAETSLIGPANIIDLHPSLDLHLAKSLTLTIDWDYFWRASDEDGLYGNAINLVRSGRASRARSIGSQLQALLHWQVNRHASLTFAYAHFFPGRFLEETGASMDVNYVSAWLQYRF